ncbi:hypothetical protein B7P43_G11667 [Cryptotermes secundus]|uniref:Endonuclease/exonuclease/phosphatase domain-containing protein n=1 Tax=Cryptotermes secundus TaxID=105785 RepID=A0A2J7Q2Z2_9NEOP|nr:hypothetical protein B7P43_G11667 [Cryptotermes secundus]
MGLRTPHRKNKLVTKCHKVSRTWTDSLDERSKLKKMDMRFGTWNVRSMHRAGSLRVVAEEISKYSYKLDLVGVQDVRWGGGGIEPAGECTFFYGGGNETHELGSDFVVHKRIILAVILRGRRCDIIVLNVHAPTDDKIDDMKGRFYEELEHVLDKFPKYHMNILLGDFNAEVCRKDLHEINNDNEVRIATFATSRNLIVRSTMFPHRNIHKFSWTSPDGKIQNQIDHTLIDRKRHSSILDIRSFRAADCDTDNYLDVAKVKERLFLWAATRCKQNVTRTSLLELTLCFNLTLSY